MATYRWRIDFSLPGLPIARPLRLGPIELNPAQPDGNGRSRSLGTLALDTDKFLQESQVETAALERIEPLAIAAASLGGSVREPTVTSHHVVLTIGVSLIPLACRHLLKTAASR